MLVKDWMTPGSINLGLDTTVLDAADIMRRRNIRQLPVIDGAGKLVGIVSDRDVRDAMPSKFLPLDGMSLSGGGLASLKVRDIMTPAPITISPDNAVETAAEMLLRHKIGGLPVVDDYGNLVGIITETDIFKFLCIGTGLGRGGIQLVFKVDDKPGRVIELLGWLRDQEVRLTSVLTCYERAEPGSRQVSIRIQSAGRHTVENLMELLAGKYELLYYVTDGKAVTG